MKATIVFLGPSLALEQARQICDATYLPPAAVGDVFRAARRRPARIALIDGYFERMAAVWHKELLFAMEAGVEVFGAASMGALRAAELARFGMIGVGGITRAFRSGALVDDDEVAVAHLPAEHGYRAVSDAMVAIRAGLARALGRGRITARTHDALLALGKATFYPDRSWPALLAAGREHGLPARQLDALAREGLPDPKANDARALLERLATTRPRVMRPKWKLARTWFWDRFVEAALSAGRTDRE